VLAVALSSCGGDDASSTASAREPRSVELAVGPARSALPGTLTLPAGTGPWPAVVLVAGSGPQDRDETVQTVAPFRDLADGLARRGVATYRYEKRTKARPADLVGRPITVDDEYVRDAVAAVRLVRRRREIDPARVFVLGHSQGGTVAPRIAAATAPPLAGLVLLAAATEPFEQSYLRQVRYLASLDGDVSAVEQGQIDQVQHLVDLVESPALTPDTPASALLGIPASYWIDLRGYDPVAAAVKLPIPMLIARGDHDYQVRAQDLEAFRAALGGRRDVVFKTYPALGHPFIAGPATPAVYAGGGHVADVVIADIAAFVERR
jgi:dienelactone hydrolase